MRVTDMTHGRPIRLILLFSLPLMLPLTTYLSRKLYKLTGNVWLVTILITLLVSWGTVSSIGYNTYIEQSVWSNFFYI